MARIEKFEDLEVWKNARIICKLVEELFQTTGVGNNYSLRNKMEGSSGSVMDNIAEGLIGTVIRNLLISSVIRKPPFLS